MACFPLCLVHLTSPQLVIEPVLTKANVCKYCEFMCIYTHHLKPYPLISSIIYFYFKNNNNPTASVCKRAARCLLLLNCMCAASLRNVSAVAGSQHCTTVTLRPAQGGVLLCTFVLMQSLKYKKKVKKSNAARHKALENRNKLE